MLAIRSVLEGLFEAECFLHRLVYYLQGYAFGSIGVHKSMRAMFENSRTCWDFKNLIDRPPAERHYRAFFAVYDQLKPTLDHTLWPSSPNFDFVRRSMPGKRGPNGMFEQYRALMQRVRAAKTSAWLSRGWWRLERVRVCRVHRFAVLSAPLGRASPWCVAHLESAIAAWASSGRWLAAWRQAFLRAPLSPLLRATWQRSAAARR